MEATRCAKICEQVVIINRIDNGLAHPNDKQLNSDD